MATDTYCYEYPRAMYTTDAVVLTVREGELYVLLVQRRNDPYAGRWALPGGFLDMDEPLEACVARELEEETGIRGIRLEQLHTFGDPDRDPRGRSISTAYMTFVDADRHDVAAADDAADVAWRPVREVRGLAFDHDKMVACAVERLRAMTRYRGIGACILPDRFTAVALSALYGAVLGAPVDAVGLAARLESMGILEPAGREQEALYRFAAGHDPF